MNLEEEIEQFRRKIATDSYPMSIGELANLYREGEIDIHPEFQRIFRWTDAQKSRLIESILLGIPLPSIFVAQNEKGVWDVVDGVQRMSTIFQFMGILKDDNGSKFQRLICSRTSFLTQLEGCAYDEGSDSARALSPAQRLDFKRARVDIKIIKRESDNRAKYDLFQRLNSFGSTATPQELRNCLMVSLSDKHYKWLAEISEYQAFLAVVDLPDRLINERYHMELALRFTFLRKIQQSRLSTLGNIGEFLDSEIVPFVEFDDSRLTEERNAFLGTFQLLNDTGGADTLKRYNAELGRAEGPFSLTAFEAVALGIGYQHPNSFPTPEMVRAKRLELWADRRFSAGHATGVRAEQRMKVTIPFGRALFSN